MATIWVVLLLGVFGINPKGKYLPWAACFAGLCISVYSPFENESVRAMHLCILLPYVLQLQKNNRTEFAKLRIGISWLVIAVMIVYLLASKCRTGYLSLLFFFFFRYLPHHWVYRTTALGLIIGSIFLSIFCMKTDSSRGRWFILQNTMELVAEKPLMGYGRNGFRHEYMQRQAAYFHKHPDSQYTMLADDIRHPLNEFLYVATNWGVFSALLLALILLVPLFNPQQKSSLRHALGAVLLFSFFCYPLRYPLPWAVIVANWFYLLKAPCIPHWGRIVTCLLLLFPYSYGDYYLRRWGQVSDLSKYGHPKAMMDYYKDLYPVFRHDADFLYDYAIESFYASRFSQAYNIAYECSKRMSSYDLSLLQGDICQEIDKPHEAMNHYREASWMCPVRFAPLEGMCEVYISMGDSCHADSIRKIILEKPLKVHSIEVEDIRRSVLRQNMNNEGYQYPASSK